MTDTMIEAMMRLASPLGRFRHRVRRAVTARPWLRLAVAPVVLLLAALLALTALMAGRHGLALLTLFIALPVATLCLILCRDPGDDGRQD